jgi:hypothetical protein
MSAAPITHVSPAFQKHSFHSVFHGYIQPAFQSDEIVRSHALGAETFLQCFDALSRSLHQLLAGRRGVIHSAFHLITRDLQHRAFAQQRRNLGRSFLHSVQLRSPRTAHSDSPRFHKLRISSSWILSGIRIIVQSHSWGGLRKSPWRVARRIFVVVCGHDNSQGEYHFRSPEGV